MKNTNTQVSDLEEVILPINYFIDDDGSKHIDFEMLEANYDILVSKLQRGLFEIEKSNKSRVDNLNKWSQLSDFERSNNIDRYYRHFDKD